jgi:hypothetical protein
VSGITLLPLSAWTPGNYVNLLLRTLCLLSNPDIHKRILLLILAKHINFSTTWLPIYIEQNSFRPPIAFDKMMFFQIEAVVVKNAKRQDFVDRRWCGYHQQN